MKNKAALHSLILLTATIMVFFWVENEILSYYSLQLTALLLLTLIVSHHLLKPTTFRLVESTISTMAVLLISQTTGGILSPLFFLNYFLLYELSLLLEPVIPLVLSSSFILFYILTNHTPQSPIQWLQLLAFPIMTPLSIYVGTIYQKVLNQKKEIRKLSEKIEDLEEELVEEEVGKNNK